MIKASPTRTHSYIARYGMGKVDDDTMQDFIGWLCSHEDDIKREVDDFWKLRDLFKQLIGREAGQVVPEEPW